MPIATVHPYVSHCLQASYVQIAFKKQICRFGISEQGPATTVLLAVRVEQLNICPPQPCLMRGLSLLPDAKLPLILLNNLQGKHRC